VGGRCPGSQGGVLTLALDLDDVGAVGYDLIQFGTVCIDWYAHLARDTGPGGIGCQAGASVARGILYHTVRTQTSQGGNQQGHPSVLEGTGGGQKLQLEVQVLTLPIHREERRVPFRQGHRFPGRVHGQERPIPPQAVLAWINL
jgi:hypothetical protein